MQSRCIWPCCQFQSYLLLFGSFSWWSCFMFLLWRRAARDHLIAFESRIQLKSLERISTSRSLTNACSFQKSTTTTTKFKANFVCAIVPTVGLSMEYTLNELREMSLLRTKCSPSYKHSLWKSCSQRSYLHNQTTQATRRTLHPTEPKVMCTAFAARERKGEW